MDVCIGFGVLFESLRSQVSLPWFIININLTLLQVSLSMLAGIESPGSQLIFSDL